MRPLKKWMSNLICALPFVQNKRLKAMQEDTVYDGSKVEALDGWSYYVIDEVIKEVGKIYLADCPSSEKVFQLLLIVLISWPEGETTTTCVTPRTQLE